MKEIQGMIMFFIGSNKTILQDRRGKTMKHKRNYGVDLLRIVSTFSDASIMSCIQEIVVIIMKYIICQIMKVNTRKNKE